MISLPLLWYKTCTIHILLFKDSKHHFLYIFIILSTNQLLNQSYQSVDFLCLLPGLTMIHIITKKCKEYIILETQGSAAVLRSIGLFLVYFQRYRARVLKQSCRSHLSTFRHKTRAWLCLDTIRAVCLLVEGANDAQHMELLWQQFVLCESDSIHPIQTSYYHE